MTFSISLAALKVPGFCGAEGNGCAKGTSMELGGDRVLQSANVARDTGKMGAVEVLVTRDTRESSCPQSVIRGPSLSSDGSGPGDRLLYIGTAALLNGGEPSEARRGQRRSERA